MSVALSAALPSWRRFLRVAGLLAATGGLLGALTVLALPRLPVDWRLPVLETVSWLPGVDLSLELRPESQRRLLSTSGGSELATLREGAAEDGLAGSEDGAAARIEVTSSFGLVLALWGAFLGLLASVPTARPATRRPILYSLGAGTALGLLLSLSFTSLGGSWPAFGLRTLAGLPGLHAVRPGLSQVPGVDTTVAQEVTLRSDHGVVARHPGTRGPWTSEQGRATVTARGQVWLAGYATLFVFGLALLASLRGPRSGPGRWLLSTLGLTVVAWFGLAALANSQRGALAAVADSLPPIERQAASDVEGGSRLAVAGRSGSTLATLPDDPARPARVTLRLLAVLALGLGALLAPLLLAVATAQRVVQMFRRRQSRKEEAERESRWLEATRVAELEDPEERKRAALKADLDSWLAEQEPVGARAAE